MKREILFKGKGLNGIWYKGNLIESSNGECYILQKNSNPIRKGSNGYWDINSPCFQVHQETVCQFTGLLDKNGNKIFEGDKLTKKEGVYWLVKWSSSSEGWRAFRYILNEESNEYEQCNHYPTGHGVSGILLYENIFTGNIHDETH